MQFGGRSLSGPSAVYPFVESEGVTAVCFRKLQSLCVLLGAIVLLTGCGGGGDAPTTAPVKGLVTYKGTPVANLSIAFIPDNGPLATGKTDASGKFELMTNKLGDGATIGTHKVAISFVPDEIPPMGGPDPGVTYKAPVSPIPKKYADVTTSGLTKTVEKDAAKNDFTFDLTD
jgi:hypothetical protein